jgi:transposase
VTEKARQRERRLFSREFKLAAIRRMEDCGNVSALADELGVRREQLYKWRGVFLVGGAEGLINPGRPRPSAAPPDLRADEARVAALERKVGEQALLIDFFKGALRRIEASRQASTEPGGTASSPRSKR